MAPTVQVQSACLHSLLTANVSLRLGPIYMILVLLSNYLLFMFVFQTLTTLSLECFHQATGHYRVKLQLGVNWRCFSVFYFTKWISCSLLPADNCRRNLFVSENCAFRCLFTFCRRRFLLSFFFFCGYCCILLSSIETQAFFCSKRSSIYYRLLSVSSFLSLILSFSR